jgi:hypothetical protein
MRADLLEKRVNLREGFVGMNIPHRWGGVFDFR